MGLCPTLDSSSWTVTGVFGAVLDLFGVGSGSSESSVRAVFRGLAAGLVVLTILDGKCSGRLIGTYPNGIRSPVFLKTNSATRTLPRGRIRPAGVVDVVVVGVEEFVVLTQKMISLRVVDRDRFILIYTITPPS